MRVDATGRTQAQLSVPNGSSSLAYEIGSSEVRLLGPLTKPRWAAPTAGVVGIRFRPGAPSPNVGGTPHDLRDAEVPLDLCWGRAGRQLGEELSAATSASAALALLVASLRRRLDCQPPQTRLAADVLEQLQPWRANTIGAVSGALFLSERQLRRRVEAIFGLGPKQLQSLLRFQAFLAFADGTDRLERLARLALSVGYADQSHLTRDSVRFTGMPPGRLMRTLATSCRARHDHTVSYAPLRVRFLQDQGRGARAAFGSTRVAT